MKLTLSRLFSFCQENVQHLIQKSIVNSFGLLSNKKKPQSGAREETCDFLDERCDRLAFACESVEDEKETRSVNFFKLMKFRIILSSFVWMPWAGTIGLRKCLRKTRDSNREQGRERLPPSGRHRNISRASRLSEHALDLIASMLHYQQKTTLP